MLKVKEKFEGVIYDNEKILWVNKTNMGAYNAYKLIVKLSEGKNESFRVKIEK